MIFWRIFNDTVYTVKDVNNLGFEESEGLRIPDEYLEQQEFTILRTAWGIGDWGIISAMPRLLKQKYPNCKIYVPSKSLIKKLFNVDTNVMYDIFGNNPYVDEFKDSVEGEIFHDHYRIYQNDNPNIPLLEQILKFWQFKEEEYSDSQPELYWSDEEKKLGDYIIENHCREGFGCLLISDRFGTQYGKFDQKSFDRDTKNICGVLKDNDIPYFYWSYKPLKETPFNFIKKALNLRHINLRIQLYIKSKAKLNVGNQCGTNHLAVRYSKVYESQRQFPLAHNFIKEEIYL
tara:strand:+ start:231 stop:1097 length:867 start_codon:yes stop_codon:yes gene_type:complete